MSSAVFWAVYALVVALVLLSTRALCRRIVPRCDRIIGICEGLLQKIDREHAAPPRGTRS